MPRRSIAHDSPLNLAQRAAAPMLLVLVLFYLGFHAVSGERGLFAWYKEARKLAVLEQQVAEMRSKREQLEAQARRLSDASLDLDVLDEQARRMLGTAGKDELVIFLPQK